MDVAGRDRDPQERLKEKLLAIRLCLHIAAVLADPRPATGEPEDLGEVDEFLFLHWRKDGHVDPVISGVADVAGVYDERAQGRRRKIPRVSRSVYPATPQRRSRARAVSGRPLPPLRRYFGRTASSK